MKEKFTFWFFMLAIFFITVFLLTGCTFHFKATDVEAEGHTNATYELKSVGLLQNNPTNSGKDGIGRFVTF